MRTRRRFPSLPLTLAVVTLMAAPFAVSPAVAGTPGGEHAGPRFATFNAALYRSAEGELAEDLASPDDEQARAVAEVIQRQRPDVLLVNEFDHDGEGRAVELFQRNYLSVGQNGAAPIEYPHTYTAESNTGVASGADLDNDGVAVTEPGEPGYAGDAFGFGEYPGQYGMVVFSRYPVDTDAARAFRTFRWADMPGARLPTDPETGESFYSEEALEVLRLSSKSHWDLPVRLGRGRAVHFLVSHPTPPSFDGPERRNVARNHDEIRFWADYVTPGEGGYIYDDEGARGGLRPGAPFVIAGDLNTDPEDGDGDPEAIARLLDSPRVNGALRPTSEGGTRAAREQEGANGDHSGDPALDTADFADDPGPGNLRVDYVLPSRGLPVRDTGVFWPAAGDPGSEVVETASDHRMVWVDLR
ncbi:endonuclease/exonuclease/phosphatase family protein [Halostreptopolyspora alba]|uniref:Endonuclease/exonuclease/phosphatase family protein n=1 Tax=Halostreptopolyspora alba TaxID=2487137 RepID=A0A3N0EFL7_9ACTN|nr:endonuclease/exonuclease/phosphatase family protein [Nocardiopsaceae bacterium YIM 96095]